MTFEILFRWKTQKAIVCPLKCGTKLLYNVFANTHSFQDPMLCGNTTYIDEFGKNIFVKLLGLSTKKFFIYRDPLERFISWYRDFVVYKADRSTDRFGNTLMLDPSESAVINFARTLFDESRTLEQNMIEVWTHPVFETIFRTDPHLTPAYDFFKQFNEPVEEYEIVHTKSLVKLLQLEYFPEFDYKTVSSYSTMPSLIHESYQKYMHYWNDDYTILYPRVITL